MRDAAPWSCELDVYCVGVNLLKLASIIIIYIENNNVVHWFRFRKKKDWKHLKWAFKLCKQVVWNCSFSAEFQILTILRFLLKDRGHCLGNSRELHLLTWTKTEQTTWHLRVICIKLPTTTHMLPSRRLKSFQPDKSSPSLPLTQQQSRQSSVSFYSPSARLTSSREEHTGAPTAPDQHRRLWPTFKLGPSALNNVYWKVLWKHSNRHVVMFPPTSEPNKRNWRKKLNSSDVRVLWLRKPWEPYRLNSNQRSPRPPRQTYNVWRRNSVFQMFLSLTSRWFVIRIGNNVHLIGPVWTRVKA